MKITFKLYATLQDRLPSSAVDNAVELEVGNETTLHELIDKFGVKREQAHLVLVNGRYCDCLLYTSPSPRDATLSRMPSSA